jgi:hypothetical protein
MIIQFTPLAFPAHRRPFDGLRRRGIHAVLYTERAMNPQPTRSRKGEDIPDPYKTMEAQRAQGF